MQENNQTTEEMQKLVEKTMEEQLTKRFSSLKLPFLVQGGTTTFVGSFLQTRGFKSGTTGSRMDQFGNVEINDGTFRGQFEIGGFQKTIDNTQNIQDALDDLESTGGTLYLKPGIYTPSSSIIMTSNVSMVGAGPGNTIIDFGGNAYHIDVDGDGQYSTGTITDVTSEVNVTGSGTSWSANITALQSQLNIYGRWYLVASVTDDTHIVLAEPYTGPAISGGSVSYTASIPIIGVTLRDMLIQNSSTQLIIVSAAKAINLSGLVLTDGAVGLLGNVVSPLVMDNCVSYDNSSHGFQFVDSALLDIEGSPSYSNGGDGYNLDGCRYISLVGSISEGNTGDGVEVKDCKFSTIQCSTNINGESGIQLTSGNEDIQLVNSLHQSNGADGIELTASSDYCRIVNCYFDSNSAYGVDIAASSCDNTIIGLSNFNANGSGTVNDSGTSTVQSGNN